MVSHGESLLPSAAPAQKRLKALDASGLALPWQMLLRRMSRTALLDVTCTAAGPLAYRCPLLLRNSTVRGIRRKSICHTEALASSAFERGGHRRAKILCPQEKICPRKSFLHRTCTCKRDAIAVSQVELHPTFFSEFGASARRARRESASRRFGCRPLSLGAQRRECHGALTGKVGYRPRAWRILAQHQADHRRQRDWPTICMARQ